MAEVTQEMVLDYLIRKGGVVKNVDLVRHFKKYLQIDDPAEKGTLLEKCWIRLVLLDLQTCLMATVCVFTRVGQLCGLFSPRVHGEEREGGR